MMRAVMIEVAAHRKGLDGPWGPDHVSGIMSERFTSFAAFWPYYLREHSRPLTRALHYAGTSLLLLIAVAVLLTGRWWGFAMLPVAGYGFAWAAHFLVEKNRPATFTYPLWSLAADFKMWALWISGRLGPELERAGVEPAAP